MKEKFPYPGNPITVTTEMCDMNGHMNVADYARIFDDGSTELYQDMGFTDKYFKEGFSSFTLEMNIQYLTELIEGEVAFPYYRIINVSPKLIHYGGILLKEDETISATNEQMLVHIDMSIRKSSKMPASMQENLQSMCREHNQTGDIGFDLRLQIR
ncbi:MAG: thioesterase family protein [SAR86 cluster bacterium]|jgi:acyl-CoA thioester hydrolase|nr:thioesterase family protein [SAR86 cluster bacterium]